MSVPQPPYPSFALALSKLNQDSMRLPSYRESHLERYHPYPRCSRPLDHLMNTVDYRYVEEPTHFDSGSSASWMVPSVHDYTDGDALNLELAVELGSANIRRRRRRLSDVIIVRFTSNVNACAHAWLRKDLALAVRRKCQRVAAVKLVLSPSKSPFLDRK
ncbi:hypothetical protein A0H81_04317 [Grifola frondosa]|uniref:Uncharacterized protein n=1 Tax=Grifola frondosa TaxID=5627 RepID=A0A1C7MEJ9_GRIFR|nr:hypothetical protein A0H81_04317 [Grifola frondosa]